jgi:hypothetical protein
MHDWRRKRNRLIRRDWQLRRLSKNNRGFRKTWPLPRASRVVVLQLPAMKMHSEGLACTSTSPKTSKKTG